MTQKTLVLIKPDGVRRGLIGEIINRYETQGLKVVKMKLTQPDAELVGKHYPEDEEYMISIGKKSSSAEGRELNYLEQGRMIVRALRDYLTSGPVVAMILEGDEAIALVRKITGYTDPSSADKGTIRGDLGIDSIVVANGEGRPVENLIHASGNAEEAEAEIALWFGRD